MIDKKYMLGDWVQAKTTSSGRLTPPMKIVGLWESGVYLEIDPEQGDPFEYEYEDIEPIPLTAEVAALTQLPLIGGYRPGFGFSFHGYGYVSVNYVHELQHLLSVVSASDEKIQKYYTK